MVNAHLKPATRTPITHTPFHSLQVSMESDPLQTVQPPVQAPRPPCQPKASAVGVRYECAKSASLRVCAGGIHGAWHGVAGGRPTTPRSVTSNATLLLASLGDHATCSWRLGFPTASSTRDRVSISLVFTHEPQARPSAGTRVAPSVVLQAPSSHGAAARRRGSSSGLSVTWLMTTMAIS